MLKAVLALPRTVWLLGLVSLFNDSTSELLYPLVPQVSCFSADGRVACTVGLIEGIAEATASTTSLTLPLQGGGNDKVIVLNKTPIGEFGIME